jgi:hypothetical protein
MAVYVDPLMSRGWIIYGRPVANCHLFTDALSLDELHAIAQRIGMQKRWFQNSASAPHYDLTPDRKFDAIAAGAIEVGSRHAAQIWQARRAMLADVHKPEISCNRASCS